MSEKTNERDYATMPLKELIETVLADGKFHSIMKFIYMHDPMIYAKRVDDHSILVSRVLPCDNGEIHPLEQHFTVFLEHNEIYFAIPGWGDHIRVNPETGELENVHIGFTKDHKLLEDFFLHVVYNWKEKKWLRDQWLKHEGNE